MGASKKTYSQLIAEINKKKEAAVTEKINLYENQAYKRIPGTQN